MFEMKKAVNYFLTVIGCIIILGIFIFNQLFYNDFYTEHSLILKKKDGLEKRIGISFPESVKYYLLNSYTGIGGSGENLKISLSPSDLEVFLKSLKSNSITKSDRIIFQNTIENHPEWELGNLKEGITISGSIETRGMTYLIVPNNSENESIVYVCYREND